MTDGKDVIGRIIKPNIACHPLKKHQMRMIKVGDWTSNKQETAEELCGHFSTIGTRLNHNYDETLNASRRKAREYDKPYDYIPSDEASHNEQMDRLVHDYSFADLAIRGNPSPNLLCKNPPISAKDERLTQ
eukprot:49580_1